MTQTTNYKSDFDFLMKLTDCRELAQLKPSEYDWECILYTTDPTKTYPFSHKNGKYENCVLEDDGETIHVIVNNHCLLPGEVFAEFTAHIPNDLYPDGEKRVVVKQNIGIRLTREGGCPSVEQVELILPTIKGDKGEKGEAAEVLPKIEFEKSTGNGYRTFIRNYEYYLERGYVPLLFRKCSRNIKLSETDEDTPNARSGWQVCGGQGVISFAEDGDILITTNGRQRWDDYTRNVREYISAWQAPSNFMGKHLIYGGQAYTPYGTREGWMAISWGRSRFVLYREDTGEINPDIIGRMFRFRFAIGFVKPYKQGKVRITPKDCVSNLAEFSVRLVVYSTDTAVDKYSLTY